MRRKKVRIGSDTSPVPAVSAKELTQSESLRESSWEQLYWREGGGRWALEGRRREMGIGGEEGDGYWREGGGRWVLEGRRRETGIGGKEEGKGERGRGGGAILYDERGRGYI